MKTFIQKNVVFIIVLLVVAISYIGYKVYEMNKPKFAGKIYEPQQLTIKD